MKSKRGDSSAALRMTGEGDSLKRVDRTQCRTCLYRPTETERQEGNFGCAYIILTEHRRPSEPSPNCTAYKPYTKAERKRLEDRLRWKREFELPVQRKGRKKK